MGKNKINQPALCIDCGQPFIKTSPNKKYCNDCSKKHRTRSETKSKIKYNDAAYDRIAMRVKKGDKERLMAHAKKQGESINHFINRAVDTQIAIDDAEK